ncbi:hypothetical protein D9758_017812 [Tetrapyrgos nigripes]|uniref:DUF1793-domain-containing protein n=1 Tax=Tetrapyrgos nigripes TaxID=182062 RepID=A0A8H5BHT5_9AGAR|nr:hypothetical protein D9758_017812 [Tetrapyrgos nigripes]
MHEQRGERTPFYTSFLAFTSSLVVVGSTASKPPAMSLGFQNLGLFSLFSVLFLSASLSVSAQNIRPGAIPLAVRSPSLSAWLSGPQAPSAWPQFWTQSRTLGWSGLICVDGQLYEWLGLAFEGGGLTLNQNPKISTASLQSIQITPTQTIMSYTAGNSTNNNNLGQPLISFNVTFLSPIEPGDAALQSLEFVYVDVDVESLDGQGHDVQVYQDFSGEWLSSDNTSPIKWTITTSSSGPAVVYHSAQKQAPQSMVTNNEMAEDVTLYHATMQTSGMTFQTGDHHVVRSLFLNSGTLANSQDTAFREISDTFPVFAFSQDLGTTTSTGSSPMVWAVGIVRDRSINYPESGGTQGLSPAWKLRWGSVGEAIQAFLADSSDALSRSMALDAKILSSSSGGAGGISSQYADIVNLAMRQVSGGLEVTIPPSSTSRNDILMFLKDIGISERAQPVEVLYASWPAMMYVNATWGRYLLQPLLMYEGSSGLYQTSYAAPDLAAFMQRIPLTHRQLDPNVLRSLDDTSSMLIMAYTHARFSGDGSLIGKYYDVFKTWTDQLVPNALMPNGFSTSDGQSSANMTNLALKAILSIRAMGEMSDAAGNEDDAKKYRDQATGYIQQWVSLGTSGAGHLTSTYGDASSWGLMYNLYADKLMGTRLVPDDNAPSFGLQYDSNADDITKSQWLMFAAATMTDSSTRDTLISQVHAKVVDQKNVGVFPTTYNVNDGSPMTSSASAAVGGMYSLLALTLQAQSIRNIKGDFNSSSKSKSKAGAIAGGVVGGLAFIALVALGTFLWRRRARRGLQGVKSTNAKNGAPDGLDGLSGQPPHPSQTDQIVTPERQILMAEYDIGNNLTSTSPGPGTPYSPPANVYAMYNDSPSTSPSNVNLIGASAYSLGGDTNAAIENQQRNYSSLPPGAALPRPASSHASSITGNGTGGRSPLVLHNVDSDERPALDGTTRPMSSSSIATTSHSTSMQFSTPQAPPLPSKQPIRLSVGMEVGYGAGAGTGVVASGGGSEAGGTGLGHQVKGNVSSQAAAMQGHETNGNLRDEVELLRREMAEMRSRTEYEPPPGYQ